MERASLIGHVKIKLLKTDEKYSFRGDTLQQAIEEDRKAGLIPFYVRNCYSTLATSQHDFTLPYTYIKLSSAFIFAIFAPISC